jgi:hypothetical protein
MKMILQILDCVEALITSYDRMIRPSSGTSTAPFRNNQASASAGATFVEASYSSAKEAERTLASS